MGVVVNLLGLLTAGLCAFLLLRAYRRVGMRLLLWSGLCFAGLTLSSGLLIADLVVFPEVNLYIWRLAGAALSMLLLLYGLVMESD